MPILCATPRAGLFALCLGLVWGCQRNAAPNAHEGTPLMAHATVRSARLLVTAEFEAQLLPEAELGGLSALVGHVDRISGPKLLVDAGNLLFRSALSAQEPPKPTAADLDRAMLVARSYRRLDALALNLTEADLAGGAQLLKALQREGATPFVSANLRPRVPGPAVARSFIRRVGGIAFGITGLSGAIRGAQRAEMTAIEPATALVTELRGLKARGADLLVLLAYLEPAEAEILAEELPEIDILILGKARARGRPPGPPRRVGPVWLFETAMHGQGLAELELRMGPRAAPDQRFAVQLAGDPKPKRADPTEKTIRYQSRPVHAGEPLDRAAERALRAFFRAHPALASGPGRGPAKPEAMLKEPNP